LAGKGIIWLETPFELETLLDLLAGIDDNPQAKLRAPRPDLSGAKQD
jgi:hypothetical protein